MIPILGLTSGGLLRYIFLPQFLPRLRELFQSGFTYLACFMAQVFRAGGILPAGHPYLQTSNAGTFGLMDVLSTTASLVPFERQHIDKVIFFFAILAGIVILAIQCLLVLLSVFVGPALAQTQSGRFTSILTTPDPSEDIALRLMDRVFGIPELFGSKDAPESVEGFHAALHSLLQFYSLGLLVIAAIILAYFIFAIVAETAETGTPFGKRYNHVWAPVRLVVAFGLLIPIGYGLNSSQWITLHVAKFGSGFATNGWLKFNEVLGEQYKILSDSEDGEELVHIPERPDIRSVIMFMDMVRSCTHATKELHSITVLPYLVKGSGDSAGVRPGDYQQARDFFDGNGNIYIRFGQLHSGLYSDQKGYVYPYCGEIMVPTGDTHREGARLLNEYYYNLVMQLWNGSGGNSGEGSSIEKMNLYARNDAACSVQTRPFSDECGTNPRPADFATTIMEEINKEFDEAILESVKAQRQEFLKGVYGETTEGGDTTAGTIDELKKFGWGGAGIYYNTVATMNGAIATSLHNIPYPVVLPSTMQQKRDEMEQHNRTGATGTGTTQSGRGGTQFVYRGDEYIYAAIERTQNYWQSQIASENTENIIVDTINLILGTNAIFDMCKNADVHPLAQLAGVGRGLMESATRNLGIAMISSIAGIGLSSVSQLQMLGSVAAAASQFYLTFAMIGLMIGFLMYYVVPFMPFLYFFFAVTGWVKGVFEAMVGLPLWALAHLRIDGQGLPGDAAAQGYFLILEIFLRPILIIFGLLAAISIFAAMVRVLNDIFVLVVANVGGFNVENIDLCGVEATSQAAVGSAEYYRGPIDQFFFTIVYAIVVYLIGTSTFKMIDAVPNKVLRWMGTSVQSFGDAQKDAGEGLLQRLSAGGYIITGQLQQGVGQLGSIFRDGSGKGAIPLAGSLAESLSPPPPPPPPPPTTGSGGQ